MNPEIKPEMQQQQQQQKKLTSSHQIQGLWFPLYHLSNTVSN